MAEQTVIDMEVELNLLRTRIDAIRNEVTTFLSEVGAPNLVEARDRYRRFAAAAVELPAKIDRLQAEIRGTARLKEDAENRAVLGQTTAKDLRTSLAAIKAEQAVTKGKLVLARSALTEAKDLLESPMYASMIEDSRRTIRSLDSALRDIPAETPTDEVIDNAQI